MMKTWFIVVLMLLSFWCHSQTSDSTLAHHGGTKKFNSRELNSLREKVYLHTDRNWYSRGTTIWFKAYLFYADETNKDILSKVLYVDLIDSLGKRVDIKILKIDNSVAWGSINLPPTISPGNYTLRAYTNWMLTFKLADCYLQSIPIVDQNEYVSIQSLPDDNSKVTDSSFVTVNLEKTEYSTREQIKFTLDYALPITGYASISVTDATFDGGNTSSSPISRFSADFRSLDYEVELLDVEHQPHHKGKIAKTRWSKFPTQISFIDSKSGLMHASETNRKGEFDLFFDLNDSVRLIARSNSIMGRPGEMVSLQLSLPEIKFFAQPVKKVRHQDLLAERYRNKGVDSTKAFLLEDVYVQAKKIYRNPNPIYASFSIRGDQLASSNVLSSLGNLPGIQIVAADDPEYPGGPLRAIMRRLGDPLPVIIYVDGVASSEFEVAGLDSSTVLRIDLYRDIEWAVVVIITKRREKAKAFQLVKARGYDTPLKFDQIAPSEDVYNFNQTIFWSPNVPLKKNQLNSIDFYASDLPGTYKIVIEGVTEEGGIINSVKYFTVK